MSETEAMHLVEQLREIVQLTQKFSLADLSELLNQMERERTTMPILDPTLFMSEQQRISDANRIFQSFARFRKEIDGKNL
jgi:hypothetical protein